MQSAKINPVVMACRRYIHPDHPRLLRRGSRITRILGNRRWFWLVICALLAACGPQSTPQVFQATLPPTQNNAPIYSPTPTRTPTLTPTLTFTPTLTPTPTLTATPTLTPTLTASPTPTQPLFTLTAASSSGAPAAFDNQPAAFAPTDGWNCGDFPCEDDIDGFMERIRVPEGYTLDYVGQFPGLPMQIAYGPDGRLYATVLESGTRTGAVYALNADGSSQRYSELLVSPVGLAFQPGTDVLYVSGRVTLDAGGGIWRVLPDGTTEPVITDLPCCYTVIDNQPNGMTFGPDGHLYIGVGALTDHAEPSDPQHQRYADIDPREAAILRVNPHTGETEVYAQGLRNPYDLTFDSTGQLYATDNGLVSGPGDRLVAVEKGKHYGWPYWRSRGCGEECPPTDFSLDSDSDLIAFPDYSLPRGLVAYAGTQFPANLFDHLFITLWNGTDHAQRIVRIDPADWRLGREDYTPEPFVTGLIRPVDVILDPEGALVIADFIYGHIWRVRYTGESTLPPLGSFGATPTAPLIFFVTSTPAP